jgi:hypothetical protein
MHWERVPRQAGRFTGRTQDSQFMPVVAIVTAAEIPATGSLLGKRYPNSTVDLGSEEANR